MIMLSLPRARGAPAERSKRYSYESWGTVSISLFSATATLVQFYREESGGGRLLLICAVPSRFGLPRHIFRSAGMQLFLPCGVQPLPSASDGVSFSRALARWATGTLGDFRRAAGGPRQVWFRDRL